MRNYVDFLARRVGGNCAVPSSGKGKIRKTQIEKGRRHLSRNEENCNKENSWEGCKDCDRPVLGGDAVEEHGQHSGKRKDPKVGIRGQLVTYAYHRSEGECSAQWNTGSISV